MKKYNASKYPLRFFSMDFPSLITQSEAVERQIEDDALLHAIDLVVASGAEVIGEAFMSSDREPFRLIVYRPPSTRTLHIILKMLDDSSELHSRDYQQEAALDEFGLVDVVLVRGPRRHAELMDSILHGVTSLLISAYVSLERAYVSKYLEWRFSLLDQIYDMTNTHLYVSGMEALVGRYWFSVTDLKTSRFRYQFGESAIRQGIAWLKSHKNHAISPYQGLSILIVEDAFDAIFGEADLPFKPTVYDERTKILRLSELPHLYSGQIEFGVAERNLYGSKDMACIDIVTRSDVSLQLNCPAERLAGMRDVIEAIVEDIAQLFLKNYRRHKNDIRRMSTALDRVRVASSSWLREISMDFAAKLMKEMMGP